MKDTIKAYIVGLIDGEGSFSIQINIRTYKNRKSLRVNPRITCSLKYGGDVLNELVNCFGGQVYHYDDNMTRYNLSRFSQITRATKLLLPYLRIKKDIAQKFLNCLKMFPKKRNTHRNGYRTWDLKTTLKVAKEAITLNNSKKSPKTLNYLKKLEKIYKT